MRLSREDGADAEQLPPICDPTTQTQQIGAKAYPTQRELLLAKLMGGQGFVSSLCPIHVQPATGKTEPTDPLFGYSPAVNAIVDRLKVALDNECLPRAADGRRVRKRGVPDPRDAAHEQTASRTARRRPACRSPRRTSSRSTSSSSTTRGWWAARRGPIRARFRPARCRSCRSSRRAPIRRVRAAGRGRSTAAARARAPPRSRAGATWRTRRPTAARRPSCSRPASRRAARSVSLQCIEQSVTVLPDSGTGSE